MRGGLMQEEVRAKAVRYMTGWCHPRGVANGAPFYPLFSSLPSALLCSF